MVRVELRPVWLVVSLVLGLAAAVGSNVVQAVPPADAVTPNVAPEIPGVVAGGTKVELIKDGLNGADDPIGLPDGGIIFSEPDASRILKMDKDGHVTTLVAKSNESHGLTMDAKGRLISAQAADGTQRIGVIYPFGSEALIADSFQGKKFTRPNDVTVDRKGGVYFSDPGLNGEQKEILLKARAGRPVEPGLPPSVYYAPPGGKPVLIAEGIERPNGVLLSADEKTLWVANTNGVYVFAFDVQPDGTVRNRRNFATVEGRSTKPNGIPGTMTGADGLAIDSEGRLYVATAAGVEIFTPRGEKLGLIPSSTVWQSLAFGGPDKKTLFILGHGLVYKITMRAQGYMGRAK